MFPVAPVPTTPNPARAIKTNESGSQLELDSAIRQTPSDMAATAIVAGRDPNIAIPTADTSAPAPNADMSNP